jgi:carbonic anhydrase
MKSFTYQALVISTICGVAHSACNYGTSLFSGEPSVPASEFSYTGLTGPLSWYGLNETANYLCGKGTNQSPIDITPSATTLNSGTSCTLNVPSYPSGALFDSLGTNVEVVVNGTLVVGNKTCALAQFHFHTPSEHRISEKIYPMEINFAFEATGELPAIQFQHYRLLEAYFDN